MRSLSARPQESAGSAEDEPVRVGPPDFKALPAGAKPEQVFVGKRVYTMNVNMPNLNSATGSWIMNFAELHRGDAGGPHMTSTDLCSPVVLRKVDPKYPPTLVAERVEGEVVLYGGDCGRMGRWGRFKWCAGSTISWMRIRRARWRSGSFGRRRKRESRGSGSDCAYSVSDSAEGIAFVMGCTSPLRRICIEL